MGPQHLTAVVAMRAGKEPRQGPGVWKAGLDANSYSFVKTDVLRPLQGPLCPSPSFLFLFLFPQHPLPLPFTLCLQREPRKFMLSQHVVQSERLALLCVNPEELLFLTSSLG